MVLGTALQRLRHGAGLTAGEASQASGVPTDLITGMEQGKAEVRHWDVAGLYSAYGVRDLAERTLLLGLAHRSNCPEWWHSYQDVIPGWFTHYVGLEQAASLIRCYSAHEIPALLQTPGYARAVLALRPDGGPEREIGRRAELAMRRQHVLYGPAAARLWAVIDEAVLRRQAGPPAVMREQLRHLIFMCQRPNITIHVLSLSADAQPSVGLLAVLRLPDRELPDIAYLEQLAGSRYYRSRGQVDYFRHVLNHLALRAESAGPPEGLLAQILRDT